MSNLSKEVLRNYIKEQQFGSSGDVLVAMKEMFRDVLQEALEAEMDDELGYGKHDVAGNNSGNSRNGSYKKTLKSELGAVELSIPRDRNGDFEPKIIPKNERTADGIEDKILALYAAGMTTRDVAAQIKTLYDVEISNEFVLGL